MPQDLDLTDVFNELIPMTKAIKSKINTWNMAWVVGLVLEHQMPESLE